MSDCLDENTLAALSRGLLTQSERARVEEHIDHCAPCRRLLADVVRAIPTTPPECGVFVPCLSLGQPVETRDLAAASLKRGTSVGRYIVTRYVGAGAMGVVYAAFDPDLDRKVAIKLVRPEGILGSGTGEEGKAQLLREAQAMARLSHPNVVTVFDAGFFQNQVFIASELVEGATLENWLRLRPRTWREILEVFIQAGRGLAGAHEAGLIHRDFKPANVLVRSDNRVLVTDFSLAKNTNSEVAVASLASESRATFAPTSGSAPPATTTSGFLAGTPAYMAPEQHRGESASTKTDQFAFCVSLFEALFGCRPFNGKTYEEIAATVFRGEIVESVGTRRAPKAILRAVKRGLRVFPEDRFSSQTDLVRTLERIRQQSKRRPLFWILGVSFLLTAVVGYFLGQTYRTSPCAGMEDRLKGVWDSDKKRAVHQAFAATELPFSEDTWQRTEACLDAYAKEWVAAQKSNCDAVRSGDSAQLEELHVHGACLERRLREIKALTNVFASTDKLVLERAIDACRSLGSSKVCNAATRQTDPLFVPEDPQLRGQISRMQDALAQIEALERTGKYREGLELVRPLLKEIRPLPLAPLESEALLLLGLLQRKLDQFSDAQEAFFDALRLADATGKDRVRARALVEMAAVVSETKPVAQMEEGHRYIRQAEGVLQRLGGDEEILGMLQTTEADLFNRQSRYDEALALAKRALEIWKRNDHRLTYSGLTLVSKTLYGLSRLEEARAYEAQATALVEATEGPLHPQTALVWANSGMLLLEDGRAEEALSFFGKAQEIYQNVIGARHPDLARVLLGKGQAYMLQNRSKEALEAFQGCLSIMQSENQGRNQRTAYCLFGSAWANNELGDKPKALAFAEAAVKLAEEFEGQNSIQLARTRIQLAELLWDLKKDRARALRLVRSTLPVFEKAKDGDPDSYKEVSEWVSTGSRKKENP